MDIKVKTIIILVTAVVFGLVVSFAAFIQRSASEIESALFVDVNVRALDVSTVQHTFYINPNQIKQFILNNQTQHQILLANGNSASEGWADDRVQFVPNNYNTQQVVYFRTFPTRVNVFPGVSRTEEFSLISIGVGGPPTANVTGQPYIGRDLTPPFNGRDGEPLAYANNARGNYRRYIDVSSVVSGGHYNLIHAFVINAQLDEFEPNPANIQYRVSRWVHPDGSLTLTITPVTPSTVGWWNCGNCQGNPLVGHNHTHGLQGRPAWFNHQRVVDMVARW